MPVSSITKKWQNRANNKKKASRFSGSFFFGNLRNCLTVFRQKRSWQKLALTLVDCQNNDVLRSFREDMSSSTENKSSQNKDEKKVENKEEQKIANTEPKKEKQKVKKEKPLSTKEKLAKAEKEVLSLKDRLARNLAEFENFRKRSIKEREQWIKYATENIILEVCDVLDNFERALDSGAQKHQFEEFMKGTKQIYAQLVGLLKKEGVEKLESQGKEFDPELHEALSHVPAPGVEKDCVAFVVKNGYKKGDKILRPAQVAVSCGE